MVAINIREFSHNMSKYMKRVEKGERIIIMRHNVPVMDLVPHQEQPAKHLPSWKRGVKPVKLKNGVSATEALLKNREEERW